MQPNLTLLSNSIEAMFSPRCIQNLVAMVAEQGDCSLHIAREKFLQTGYGFPLQQGSAYLDSFNSR